MIRNVLRNLVRRPATRTAAETAARVVPGYRGGVSFDYGECNFCGACATRCPAGAIVVDRPNRHTEFDLFRCVQCGACAEACKRGCVQLSTSYVAPVRSRPIMEYTEPPASTPAPEP